MSALDLCSYLRSTQRQLVVPDRDSDRVAVLLSDSKARYLEAHFSTSQNIPLHFLYESGWGSERLVSLLEERLPHLLTQYNKPAVVYIWTGTCDITHKGRHRLLNIAHWDNTSVHHIVNQLHRARDIVLKHNCTVKYITLPPQSVSIWNRQKSHQTKPSWDLADKQALAQTTKVNQEIDKLNTQLGRNTLKFHWDLFKTRKGRAAKCYIDKLCIDGIHPSPLLAEKWLRRLELDIIRECFIPELTLAVDPQEVLAIDL